MNELLEIEQIKRLKHKYFRALDTNNWELMAECLTEDCTARYDSGKYSYDNRQAILDFLSKFMDGPKQLTLHQGHHPEIEILSETEATGIWYLQDMVINLENNTTLRGAGFYEDRYTKAGGQWCIKYTGYERTYEEVEERDERMRITSNMFSR